MVDRWEQQIADGITPDLLESFNEESLQQISKIREIAKSRDPYAAVSIKDTFESVANDANRSGLHVKGQTPLDSLFSKPTFGGDFDPDE